VEAQHLLNSVDFPEFVADPIEGVLDSIIDASIQQSETYGQLLPSVAKTVARSMDEHITFSGSSQTSDTSSSPPWS
jgi:hypothetical protein